MHNALHYLLSFHPDSDESSCQGEVVLSRCCNLYHHLSHSGNLLRHYLWSPLLTLMSQKSCWTIYPMICPTLCCSWQMCRSAMSLHWIESFARSLCRVGSFLNHRAYHCFCEAKESVNSDKQKIMSLTNARYQDSLVYLWVLFIHN